MPYPALIGDDPAFLERFRRMLTQNYYAFTYMVEWDGQRDSLAGIEQTIYAAAYVASSVERPRALVIGVGGGFDILTALRYDAREVTGVEINGSAEGTIVTRRLLIGPKGQFKGSLKVDEAEVRGQLRGEANVQRLLAITSSGDVVGRIRYGQLMVERGGHFTAEVGVPELVGRHVDPHDLIELAALLREQRIQHSSLRHGLFLLALDAMVFMKWGFLFM